MRAPSSRLPFDLFPVVSGIVEIVDIVDLVEIVDIVKIVDTVEIFDIVEINDIVLAFSFRGSVGVAPRRPIVFLAPKCA